MEPTHMIGTTAMHGLGDISREDGDLCFIHDETESDFIGNWVTGFGFINVRFPKETTRPLTDEEVEKYNGQKINLAGIVSTLKVD